MPNLPLSVAALGFGGKRRSSGELIDAGAIVPVLTWWST